MVSNRTAFRMAPMKDTHAFTVRMPRALAEQLKALARAEHRSLNGMVVHLLTRALASLPEFQGRVQSATELPDSTSAGDGGPASPDEPSNAKAPER